MNATVVATATSLDTAAGAAGASVAGAGASAAQPGSNSASVTSAATNVAVRGMRGTVPPLPMLTLTPALSQRERETPEHVSATYSGKAKAISSGGRPPMANAMYWRPSTM